MVAMNVAHARICTQNSPIVFNRTAPCACRLCSAFPNRDTSHPRNSMRLPRTGSCRVAWLFLLSACFFQILLPTQFRPEPWSKNSNWNINPISTIVTILNKILFGLLKFYFTLNTRRKTTSTKSAVFSSFLKTSILYFTKTTVVSSFLKPSKLMPFYFTLLCITFYFTLLDLTLHSTLLYFTVLYFTMICSRAF